MREAARYLAGASEPKSLEVDEQILEDMRILGATEDDIARWRATMGQDDEEGFEVFDDCMYSVTVFAAMGAHWDRAGADGVRACLKIDRAPLFMRMLGVPAQERRQVFMDLLTMEDETLRVLAERAA